MNLHGVIERFQYKISPSPVSTTNQSSPFTSWPPVSWIASAICRNPFAVDSALITTDLPSPGIDTNNMTKCAKIWPFPLESTDKCF